MNFALRAVIPNSQPHGTYMHLKAALFHSTPVLERRRRNQWDHRSNQYSKRFRKMQGKQQMLRNVSAFADHMFQNWQNDFDEDNPFSNGGPSWFKKQFSKKSRRKGKDNQGKDNFLKDYVSAFADHMFQNWQNDFDEDNPFSNGGPSWFKKQFSKKSRRKGKDNQGPKDFPDGPEQQHWGRGFQFCEDDFQSARVFRAAFGGDRVFYWSFIDEENPDWFTSSRYANNNGKSRNWRQRIRYEYGYSSESDDPEANMASDRLALGLKASGPLTIEDVKIAYRACALKWHPDRHQGSEKVVAEEKFKHCSAAYQSLCDSFAIA